MNNFLVNYTNVLSTFTKIRDCEVLGEELTEVLTSAYNIILILVPIAVVVLCTIDMARAVMEQNDKEMKVATTKAVKRIIIGVAIMFIPLLINTVLKIAGFASGSCIN